MGVNRFAEKNTDKLAYKSLFLKILFECKLITDIFYLELIHTNTGD